MPSPTTTLPDCTVPARVFGDLRRSLAAEAGSLTAIRALHAAGYACGEAAAEATLGAPLGEARVLAVDAFWASLSGALARRGWGTLVHEAAHPAVGTLTSSDWAEGGFQEGEDGASCSFSTGFLCGLLSAVAGNPVAVLEVTCRGRGDPTCSFAFGGAEAIHALYGRMSEGHDPGAALASL